MAEDTPSLQMLISVQLQQIGYEAVLCENGSALLAHLQQQFFPLILMDLHMPVLDGWDTTVQIRSLEADGFFSGKPRIKIIALTADTLPETVDRCMRIGMDSIVFKPVTMKVLRGILQ